ncbi:uncharacterized protein LOC131889411 [Tigriopus californicus]|uniref:uncharacterized protein LOC131889411 n=1 Tax=Tigriopus californicus TaxID=6832 RepID=UPI0027DA22CE|nr:uncharacterized protein LOC131889411 [Tigriopus californicus]
MSAPGKRQAAKREGGRARGGVGVINSQPLLQGVSAWNEPLTEDLSDTDCRDFIWPRKKRQRGGPSTPGVKTRPLSQMTGSSPKPLIRCGKKLRSSRSSAGGTTSSSSSSSQTGRKTLLNVDNHLFVGAIPRNVSAGEITKLFRKFGPTNDVCIFESTRNPTFNFGFIEFRRFEDLKKVLNGPSIFGVDKKGHKYELNVEKRRDARVNPSAKATTNSSSLEPPCRPDLSGSSDASPQDTAPSHTLPWAARFKRKSAWNQDLTKASVTALGMWTDLLQRFNWQFVAAKYLYRIMTMEDYLSTYCHALCSYWEAQELSLDVLISRLVELSETCPHHDLNEVMAPSISGLVCNQTAENGRYANNKRSFNLAAILIQSTHLFQLEDQRVMIKRIMDKNEAKIKLHHLLVEGLFIYFFAKFAHGPMFNIKIAFYERSEPIHSVLKIMTGHSDMAAALLHYFKSLSDIFVYEPKRGELTLTVDYFSKSKKEEMRPHLECKYLFHPPVPVAATSSTPPLSPSVFSTSVPSKIETISEVSFVTDSDDEHEPFSSTSGLGDAELDPRFLDSFSMLEFNPILSPVEAVHAKRLPEVQSLPHNVSSVIQPLLLDSDDDNIDFELGLVSNPMIIDKLISRLESQMRRKVHANVPQMKEDLEMECRKVIEQLLKKHNISDEHLPRFSSLEQH